MTVRRLKDIVSEEKRLRKNIESDPDSYVVFLLTYYPNINNKKKDKRIFLMMLVIYACELLDGFH